MDYSEYYRSYLNINTELLSKGQFLFSSPQRNMPICFYYYHYIILSSYNSKSIISVAPQFYDFFRDENLRSEFIKKDSNILNILRNKFKDFNIREMQRMGLFSDLYLNYDNKHKVIQLEAKDKEIYFNTLSSITDNKIKEEKWNLRKKQIDEGRMFVIIDEGKIISHAVISDINYNGGNISVWTSENYTKKGCGKSVAAEAIKWCVKNGVLPVYLVEKGNDASIKIAESLGFKTIYDEIILSKVIK